MPIAYYNRFAIEMPDEAVRACSHQGDCDADVEVWSRIIPRPAECTAGALRSELKEYGAWDAEELADDAANWQRIVWIAAGDIQEEAKSSR